MVAVAVAVAVAVVYIILPLFGGCFDLIRCAAGVWLCSMMCMITISS